MAAEPCSALNSAPLTKRAFLLPSTNAPPAHHPRVEFNLGDVFMLDVSRMKSMADYTKTLTAKQRWNFKDRQKK